MHSFSILHIIYRFSDIIFLLRFTVIMIHDAKLMEDYILMSFKE
jgi:hypothetical protein